MMKSKMLLLIAYLLSCLLSSTTIVGEARRVVEGQAEERRELKRGGSRSSSRSSYRSSSRSYRGGYRGGYNGGGYSSNTVIVTGGGG